MPGFRRLTMRGAVLFGVVSVLPLPEAVTRCWQDGVVHPATCAKWSVLGASTMERLRAIAPIN
jgi:hypothetical protein